MPATYEELLVEPLPKRIEKDADYDRLHHRLSELMRLRKRSAAETELFHLLVLLIRDYDHRHALPLEEFYTSPTPAVPDGSVGERTADLVPLFG